MAQGVKTDHQNFSVVESSILHVIEVAFLSFLVFLEAISKILVSLVTRETFYQVFCG